MMMPLLPSQPKFRLQHDGKVRQAHLHILAGLQWIMYLRVVALGIVL